MNCLALTDKIWQVFLGATHILSSAGQSTNAFFYKHGTI